MIEVPPQQRIPALHSRPHWNRTDRGADSDRNSGPGEETLRRMTLQEGGKRERKERAYKQDQQRQKSDPINGWSNNMNDPIICCRRRDSSLSEEGTDHLFASGPFAAMPRPCSPFIVCDDSVMRSKSAPLRVIGSWNPSTFISSRVTTRFTEGSMRSRTGFG